MYSYSGVIYYVVTHAIFTHTWSQFGYLRDLKNDLRKTNFATTVPRQCQDSSVLVLAFFHIYVVHFNTELL